jgi:hypothetical protein
MTEAPQRQIAQAILAGANLEEIEQAIIDPAQLDEEEKSALWLYAAGLQERPRAGVLAELDPARRSPDVRWA